MSNPATQDLFRVFGKIGLLSFGGPAAQISLMHSELVDRTNWLKEKEFLGALSFCMLLPGPEAMQLATFCGWKLRGTFGGILAGLLFVLPGAILIFLLAWLYAVFGGVPLVNAAFLGVKAVVVAIIAQALLRLSQKMLTNTPNRLVALGSFLALYTGLLPFPIVIASAGALGLFLASPTPHSDLDTNTPYPLHETLKTIAIWGTLWGLPIAGLYLIGAEFLTDVAVFFSTLAVVTFGGAYAVLAYMVQAVVQDFGWLTTGQMMDALGLAETTPGPLILVTQFVATLAGYFQGGVGLAIAAGLTALWCTFIPCFLWIFAGAPHVARILANPRLTKALELISAAVVGVIVNLSLWFTLNLLFSELLATKFGVLPVLTSFNWTAAGLVCASLILLLWRKLPLLLVLFVTALLGVASGFL